MGAFNTVTAEVPCPKCRARSVLEIQFRFGATWQYRYSLGQTLLWGKNDIGDEGRDAAVLGIVVGPCPTCGFDDDWDVVVVVRTGALTEIAPLDGPFEFGVQAETFVYLEPQDETVQE